MDEQRAATWEENKLLLLRTQERHTDQLDAQAEQIAAVKDSLRSHATIVKVTGSILGVIITLGLVVATQIIRHEVAGMYASLDAARASAVVTMTREQQIENIIDAAPKVPPLSSLRLKGSGWPMVMALARELPGQHVTAQMRDEACTRAPDACRAP